MSLIEEFKRQRVFRVGMLYMVAGWLLLQVADIIVGLLGLPNWVLRIVLYVLIAGLPLVLIFALARASFSGGHLDDRFSNYLERVVGRLVPARLHRPSPQSATHASSVAVLPFRNLGRRRRRLFGRRLDGGTAHGPGEERFLTGPVPHFLFSVQSCCGPTVNCLRAYKSTTSSKAASVRPTDNFGLARSLSRLPRTPRYGPKPMTGLTSMNYTQSLHKPSPSRWMSSFLRPVPMRRAAPRLLGQRHTLPISRGGTR